MNSSKSNPLILIKFFIFIILSLMAPQVHAEKALDVSGVSIAFTLNQDDEYMEIGDTNQVQSFWFKRSITSDFSFLFEGGDPYETLQVNTDGDFVVGTTVTESINDNDWHHAMIVTRTNSRTNARVGNSAFLRASYNVDLEYYLDNQLVKTVANVDINNRYLYKDNSLTSGGDSVSNTSTSFTLGSHEGMLDDYIVVNDLSDEEILDLYERGASSIDSDDERVKVYWADEQTFLNIDRFSVAAITVAERIVESDRPVFVHLISVQSDYGDEQFYIEVRDPDTFELVERIDGPIELARVDAGNIANIFAPEFVYLDRYRKELEPTPDNIRDFSYYRQVNSGYTAPGATIDGTSPIEIKLTVDQDISIGWSWRDEVAIFVESATEDYSDLGQADGGLSVNGQASVPGKIWVTPGETEVTAEIAKSIVPGSEISVGAESVPVRFSIKAISEENSANHSADHYLVFDGQDDTVKFENNVAIPDSSGMTFEFWARRDDVDTSEEQEIIRITDGSNILRIGFSSSPGKVSGGMFFSNAASGGVIASIDGGFIDDYWHHWAWSYDKTSQTMIVYRDGEAIKTISSVDLGVDFSEGVTYEYYKGSGIQPTLSTSDQTGSSVYEARGDGNGDLAVVGNGGSFNGSNYAYLDNDNEYVEWTIPNTSSKPFQRWLQIRYRGQDTSPTNAPLGGLSYEDQTLRVSLNGDQVMEDDQFDGDNSWNALQVLVTLQPGSNVIRATGASLSSDEEVEVDEIRIYGGTSPTSVAAAHAEWGDPTATGVGTSFDFSGADQADYYGYAWRGMLWLDELADMLEFQTISDDGSVLSIDGLKIVDNDGIQGDVTLGGLANLSKGGHDFELDFYYVSGGARMEASWGRAGNLLDSLYPPSSSVYLASSGSGAFFQGELNNVRIWGKALSAAEVETARFTDEIGNADPTLLFETGFEDGSLTSITTTERYDYVGVLSGFDANFAASIATNVEKLKILYPSLDFTEDFDAGTKVSSQTVVANDWLRVGFTWAKEYHIEVDVNDSDFVSLPFVTVDGVTYEGAAAGSVWAEEFSTVTVGTKYRTDDRCSTLRSVNSQAYLFTLIDMDSVNDGTLDGVATREYTFPALSGPGTLTFTYDRTIFRAFVSLGEGLDVSSLENLNLQLIPNLCEGAELHLSNGTPSVVFSNQDKYSSLLQNGGTKGKLPSEVQWDSVGQQLLPLTMGEYQVDWQDANDPNASYLIHLVTDFPTDTYTVNWEIEDDNGYRLTDDGDYVYDYRFGDVSDSFPASPRAHYRHIYSADANKQPPVALDSSDADQWFFQGLSFSSGFVIADEGTGEFTSSSDSRSVLLYSYRQDPTEVATGDGSQEAYAVRLVKSESISDVTTTDTILSSGNRKAFYTGNMANRVVGVDEDGAEFGIGNDTNRTLGFWVKLDASYPQAQAADRVIWETQLGASNYSVELGFRGPSHSTEPNVCFLRVDDHSPSNIDRELLFRDVTIDSSWHHWSVVFDGDADTISIYADGRLVGRDEIGLPVAGQATGNVHFFGAEGSLPSNWLNGAFDNVDILSKALSASEVRALFQGSYFGGSHEIKLSFDDDLSDNKLTHQGENAGEVSVYEFAGTGLDPVDASSGLISQTHDFYPEVATRVYSMLDTAGYGSGYLLNEVSNYNSAIYGRGNSVGTWGGIYPVNWSGVYTASHQSLDVAYYENPFTVSSADSSVLHPNVGWPYVVVQYQSVNFPAIGEHKDKRIYISSRLGTEGVDVNGVDQLVFDPASYEELAIYNQPDPDEAGYNPNEEHAIVAKSIKDQLTGNTSFGLGQSAAFALQKSLNVWGGNDSNLGSSENQSGEFTSEPWVLVQYHNLETGLSEMAAYQVELTRSGAGGIFPVLDTETNKVTDAFGVPVTQPTDPSYNFEYPTFAGDIHIPPYPLNLVIGAAIVEESWGGNVDFSRALWHDINGNAWTVAGDGRYFYRYWYPFRADFWYEDGSASFDGRNDIAVGTSMAWLPGDGVSFLEDGNAATEEDTETAQPAIVLWNTYWGDDYPVIKRGESLTYAGGEYLAENSGAEGLPALVAMAAAQVIYDSANATMVYSEDTLDVYSARIIRCLDAYQVAFSAGELPDELTPAFTDNVMVDGPRYYFKGLVGSLQKRFYYDSLSSQLIFRGRLNDLESGDPDLTVTPVSLSVLEPNVMTQSEYDSIIGMLSDLGIGSGATTFDDAVQALYEQSQNPHELVFEDNANEVTDTEQKFYSGMEAYSESAAQPGFYSIDQAGGMSTQRSDADLAAHLSAEATALAGETITIPEDDILPDYQPLSSLGAGSVLMTHPSLLTSSPTGADYITIAENNHEEAGGAVSLHIIQIGDERFRGAIKVIEAADVFSEKINIKHSGDFGGNTENIYYQWWVREVDNLDTVGVPADVDVNWQLYTEGLGLNTIAFEGRPDITLADKLFYVRYANGSELGDVTGQSNAVSSDASLAYTSEESWRVVDINDDSDDWSRSGSSNLTDSIGGAVPFQWAGASNSPQLQADGSRKYIPQLVMGWVKRVLDRINPYEARYTDFYNNESPATYSSQIQIAGAPYVGNVALNSSKNVIENVGLIELYETVLARAKSLTLDIPGASTDGTNQAVLLAATRLSFLYQLLALEAYSDAQDATVTVTSENGLNLVAPYVHAFMNQEASLLHEELALLRGTDFVKAYPLYNRLFWNYVKGEGEAAYNANYNVYDENQDGVINEFDGAALYPQGHGDSWGHFLSANKMHFELLKSSGFDWNSVAELYSLLDNVIEVDYLDEKSFARVAASKARAGNEIVKATYREAYVEDPNGQWQGYTDVNLARAWGVSEWGKRVGHGAYFDWIVGNVLVPADANEAGGPELENLHQIDRQTNVAELREIASTLLTVQQTVDGANSGFNPIGLDSDAIVFDMDPIAYDGEGGSRRTHFRQIYQKAVDAAQNAISTFEYASRAEADIRRIADNTEVLQIEAFKQDLDYRNRLIEIFGTPYTGNIGPGQIYADGYEGPDTLLYKYIDRTNSDEYSPNTSSRYTTLKSTTFPDWASSYSSLDWNGNYTANDDSVSDLFSRYYLNRSFSEGSGLSVDVPVLDIADYAFQVPDEDNDGVSDWGSRIAYGKIQTVINEILLEQIGLQKAIRDYTEYIEKLELGGARLKQELVAHGRREESRSTVAGIETTLGILSGAASAVEAYSQWSWDFAWQASQVSAGFLPRNVGFSNDLTAPARGGLQFAGFGIRSSFYGIWTGAILTRTLSDAGLAVTAARGENDRLLIEELREMNAIVSELGKDATEEESKRLVIGQHIKRLENLGQKYQSVVAEGFRLLDEREGFNIALAGNVQRNRYSDMIFRLSRNDALGKYENAFSHAVQYAWLAAKAYDYETSLSSESPYAATTVLEELVEARNLGLWQDGEPAVGQGGLAELLAQLKSNYDLLEGQLGINNPQIETGKLSLRHEHFRIRDDRSSSDDRWEASLSEKVVDLWEVPEFSAYCRPFANPEDGPQPGLVIEFDTVIESGQNIFGEILGGADHAYSSANFATKIRSAGVFFEGYNDSGLSTSPRVYLVPVGNDTLQLANSDFPEKRMWNVVEQRVSAPFSINNGNLNASGYIPSIDGIDGSFARIRRFGDFRAYHDSGDDAVDLAEMSRDSRLIGRSIANTKWLLIVPGATLHSDHEYGLKKFIETVSDIKLVFETYSHQGQ